MKSFVCNRFARILLLISMTGCQAGLAEASLSDQAAQAVSDAASNSSGGNLNGAANGNVAEFEQLVDIEAAAKVKRLLVQQGLSDDEVAAINGTKPDLNALVENWIKSPAYQDTMLHFFASAFQQSQLTGASNDGFVQNKKESFARTVLQINSEGLPFTEAITTRRLMLTTRLMYEYAEKETTWYDDKKDRKFQWSIDEPNFKFTIQKSKGPIDLTDASNAKSPNYMVFYGSRLGVSPYTTVSYPQTDYDAYVIKTCTPIDPVIYDKSSSFAGLSNVGIWIRNYLNGGDIWYHYIDPAKNKQIPCYTKNVNATAFIAADTNDWRMVTITQASPSNPQTKFTDLPSFRKGKNSMALYMPHVGYLTTLSFLEQWPTNASNSSRSTVNQALIVGLNGAVGDDKLTNVPPQPSVDPVHSADPACYSCHQDLDPLRQFYRQSISLNNGLQRDGNVVAVPALFAFDGKVVAGTGIQEFAKIIVEHPHFARSWVQKLCTWANAGPCLDSDPELLRIAAEFEGNGFKWDAMVKDLMTSPLVTYSAATATSIKLGQSSSLARLDQVCGLFKQTLGLGDICGRDSVQSGTDYSIPSLAATLPGDQYGRGVVAPLYVTQPDLIFRSTFENLCTLVAEKVYTAQSNLPLASSNPDVAMPALVHDFMGIAPADASEPTAILMGHYNDVITSGGAKDVAWRSAFTLACLSPYVAGIGQ